MYKYKMCPALYPYPIYKYDQIRTLNILKSFSYDTLLPKNWSKKKYKYIFFIYYNYISTKVQGATKQ